APFPIPKKRKDQSPRRRARRRPGVTTTETMSVATALSRGLEHHRAGNLNQAEPLYRAILKAEPRHPDALHLLGLIAHQTGHHAAGLQLVEQAVAEAPRSAVFRN